VAHEEPEAASEEHCGDVDEGPFHGASV
jgi:hypothetical protein